MIRRIRRRIVRLEQQVAAIQRSRLLLYREQRT